MTREELFEKVIDVNKRDGLGRQLVIRSMHDNELAGKDCHSCVGHCCTYEHNSMMITPFEALSIVLHTSSHIDLEILDNNIKQYRLDKLISIGSKQLRRYYTCPYFTANKGCGIAKVVKPYGCLAFNPLEKNVSKTGQCLSTFPDRFAHDSELQGSLHKMNQLISKVLDLSWSKESIPIALRDVFVKINTN